MQGLGQGHPGSRGGAIGCIPRGPGEVRSSQPCLGDSQTTRERAGHEEEQRGLGSGQKAVETLPTRAACRLRPAEWAHGYPSTSSSSSGGPCL